MKIQYLAVIFIVIILPISMVLSQYIENQIDTITLQTTYTNSLNNATFDALKAFQLNTVNNKYSTLSDSKIRDVEAAISTFYNSLETSMSKYIYEKEVVPEFVPAILFTLYDGYYIYSSYDNIYTTTGTGEDLRVEIKDDDNRYQIGLKPYIYYSCQYKLNSGKKVIVNYTLDNAITVYGDFGSGYETKSGYLINYSKVKNRNTTNKTLEYNGVLIEPETLTEHLLILDEATSTLGEGDYNYIVYKNKKVYQDVNVDAHGNAVPNGKYFWYDNYRKAYLQTEAENLINYINTNNVGFKSISAYEYYSEAYEFSKWVVETSGLGNVKQSDIVQNDGTIGANNASGELYLSTDTGTKEIFNTTAAGNDPMLSSSTFNAHREAVIRKSIETNLMTAIANFNIQDSSSFEFILPIIDEERWYQIVNNVSIVSFMQGIPIAQKYYNNYSVIINTKNEEIVNENSVYVVTTDGTNVEYHQPGCEELRNKQHLISGTYSSLDFQRQTVKVTESNIHYFYPQARQGKWMTGCYNCIVNATGNYYIDDIISNNVKDSAGNILNIDKVRKAYLTGIARERYDLYRTSKF